MKTIELKIDDFNAVTAVSIVEFPAIEEDFQFFSNNENYVFSKIDEFKRIITGPALIPDLLIPRIDKKTGEKYQVFFSKETIEKIMEKFLIEKRNDNVTLQHKENVSNISLIECWTILDSEKDKSAVLGFSLPIGTLMTSYKVNNDEVWNKIINKEVKGFSIEGSFIHEQINLEIEKEEIVNILNTDDNDKLQQIIDLLKEFDN